jgi:hypothetical protein
MAQVHNYRTGKIVTVKVGDVVGFKSDFEQYGRVTKSSVGSFGHLQKSVHLGWEGPSVAQFSVLGNPGQWARRGWEN